MNVRLAVVDPLRTDLLGVMVIPVVENTLSSDVCVAGIPRMRWATNRSVGNWVDVFQYFRMSK